METPYLEKRLSNGAARTSDPLGGEQPKRNGDTMKTRTYHISTLGRFAPRGCAGQDGYVIYHDSPRYKTATVDRLLFWVESKAKPVRNAAKTEIAERALNIWRNK